ncbi:hypothetical protein P4O66_014417 [Electrophorus voltai]|uniref:Uncharacterized protein n=1 Tax=Electrophorus voltai TaxID=2609070 RepID=A0AAD8Z075_9TELE|nr:hypothetical protein P4O66_014417 [Electrophorus voltai]
MGHHGNHGKCESFQGFQPQTNPLPLLLLASEVTPLVSDVSHRCHDLTSCSASFCAAHTNHEAPVGRLLWVKDKRNVNRQDHERSRLPEEELTTFACTSHGGLVKRQSITDLRGYRKQLSHEGEGPQAVYRVTTSCLFHGGPSSQRDRNTQPELE